MIVVTVGAAQIVAPPMLLGIGRLRMLAYRFVQLFQSTLVPCSRTPFISDLRR